MPPILPALRPAQWHNTNFGALQATKPDRVRAFGSILAEGETAPAGANLEGQAAATS